MWIIPSNIGFLPIFNLEILLMDHKEAEEQWRWSSWALTNSGFIWNRNITCEFIIYINRECESKWLSKLWFTSRFSEALWHRTRCTWGVPGGASGNESTCQYRRHKRHKFDSWVRKIPCRRERQSTAVFLPGESHGQRSLADYSP